MKRAAKPIVKQSLVNAKKQHTNGEGVAIDPPASQKEIVAKPYLDQRSEADNENVPDFPKVLGLKRLYSNKKDYWYYGLENTGQFVRSCAAGVPEGYTIDPTWFEWAIKNNPDAKYLDQRTVTNNTIAAKKLIKTDPIIFDLDEKENTALEMNTEAIKCLTEEIVSYTAVMTDLIKYLKENKS
jgi:hypothetical protein